MFVIGTTKYARAVGLGAMSCNNCGCTLSLERSEGATDGGRFKEVYKCVGCGRKGRIFGESSDMPSQWTKTGVCR